MSNVLLKVYIHTYIFKIIFFICSKLCFVVVILHLCVSLSQPIPHMGTSVSPSCPTSVPTVKSSRRLTWKPGRLNYTSYMKSSKISQACKTHYQLDTWTCRRRDGCYSPVTFWTVLVLETWSKGKDCQDSHGLKYCNNQCTWFTSKVREGNTNTH